MSQLSGQLTKRYYSTAEVGEMFAISNSVVRAWARSFEYIKPSKSSDGRLRFTPENVRQLEAIYRLVREQGYTLEGAKRMLEQEKLFFKKKQDTLKTLQRLRVFLEDLKNELG